MGHVRGTRGKPNTDQNKEAVSGQNRVEMCRSTTNSSSPSLWYNRQTMIYMAVKLHKYQRLGNSYCYELWPQNISSSILWSRWSTNFQTYSDSQLSIAVLRLRFLLTLLIACHGKTRAKCPFPCLSTSFPISNNDRCPHFVNENCNKRIRVSRCSRHTHQ